MCCKGFWKRSISFALTLATGLLAVSILLKVDHSNENQKDIKLNNEAVVEKNNNVVGCNCSTAIPFKKTEFVTFYIDNPETIEFCGVSSLKILSEPLTVYTDLARQNRIQGKVILRVKFLPNGEIGKISVVSGLPDGLTKKAISAAKQIKFEPASNHGMLVTQTKTVVYTFTIY